MDVSRGRCQINSLLKGIGMRPSELARRTGIKRQRIWDYANDIVKMSPETMYVVSRAIGCHSEDLYEWLIGKAE